MSNQPNKKDNNWIWLPAMIICFATGLWPFALVILFWKIVNGGNSSGRGKAATGASAKTSASQSAAARKADDLSKAADELRKAASDFVGSVTGKTDAGKTATDKTAPGANAGKTSQAAAPRAPKIKSGLGLIIAGATVAGLFSLGAFVTFVEALIWGTLVYMIGDLAVLLLLMAVGLVLLCAGLGLRRRRERWLSYFGYIGANKQVALAPMAAAFGVGVRRLCDDLRKMLSEKVLPAGYLDLASGKLILSDTGYQAPPGAEPQEQTNAQAADEPPQDDNAILAEIRAVNDAIPDPVMSEKIDRIGEITARILDYQRRNPGKDSQLRGFLNYYLPTTLKILRSYAQLDAQGVEGENITAAKQRIEGMMDKVVEGFETQLDTLFADSAMDISSDVAVLEQMLAKDGLSGNGQGMSL